MNRRIPVTQVPLSPSPNRLFDKIYPRSFSGIYRRIRVIAGSLLFALYFGTVWLNWGPRQAVLWDLAEKKFHIFGATYWPEDLYLLSAILIICAFGLFFITVLAGRVWCGYACPQSVWMWIFLWAEKLTEGDRRQRMKRDAGPLTAQKALRRLIKHTLWLAISVATAVTFVGYFTPIRELLPDLMSLELSGSALFWVFFFTAATYVNAGWCREKVCLHMCPYGRFQSSVVDNESMIVAYDAKRGEPRGSRRKDANPAVLELGDCIDCEMCVQVCPTGIDIRDGLQMECIGCAACIDACDSVMDKMGYAKGLVRYTSERELEGGDKKIFRPRLLGYGGLMFLFIGLLVWAIISRPLISLDVVRDRGLYRFNASGELENSYTLKVLNKAQQTRSFEIQASGIEGLRLYGNTRVKVGMGESLEIPVSISVPVDAVQEPVASLQFHLRASNEEGEGESTVKTTKFISAVKQRS